MKAQTDNSVKPKVGNSTKPLLCSRCGFFSTKLQSKHCFFNLFLCGGLKIFTLKINTLQIILQISEK